MPDLFKDLTEAAAADLGFPVVRWLPAGVVVADAVGAAHELNLVNLARRVKGSPEAEWPAVIRDFLAVALAAPPVLGPLDSHAARLRPRLGPGFPGVGPGDPVAVPLPGTDLVVNLVVDADRHMTYVAAADVAAAGRPLADWHAVACANLAAATPPDWLAVVHAESGVLAGNAGDGYDAARALVLDRAAPPEPAGYFVAVPARDWLFALAVRPGAAAHLGVLHAAATRTYESDPYPITAAVYWVRPGQPWEALALTAGAGGVDFDPPAGLAAALAGGPA